MHVARVVGQVVSTAKPDSVAGMSILLVQDLDAGTGEEVAGPPRAAVDLIGAGVGEVVLLAVGGAARMTPATSAAPVDTAVIAIVDNLVHTGRLIYEK